MIWALGPVVLQYRPPRPSNDFLAKDYLMEGGHAIVCVSSLEPNIRYTTTIFEF